MSQFLSLVDDVKERAARFLGRNDLLVLRAASRASRELVRKAISLPWNSHFVDPDVRNAVYHGSTDPRKIEATGRVFGSGTTYLLAIGDYHGPRREALVSFLGHAGSCLVRANINGGFGGGATLGELCRHVPLLTHLTARNTLVTDAQAIEISRSCPKLTDIHFGGATSAAESYLCHFPKAGLFSLTCAHGNERAGLEYRPTNLVQIEHTLRVCTDLNKLYVSNKWTPNVSLQLCRDVVDLVIGAPFSQRLHWLSLTGVAIDADTILALIRGLPVLRGLKLPDGSRHNMTYNVHFYRALALSRPDLIRLTITDPTTDDASVGAVCDGLRLYELRLKFTARWGGGADPSFTSNVVDLILASKSASSLDELYIENMGGALTSFDILRLVKGCPEISSFGWCEENLERDVDPIPLGALTRLLKSRDAYLEACPTEDGHTDHLEDDWIFKGFEEVDFMY